MQSEQVIPMQKYNSLRRPTHSLTRLLEICRACGRTFPQTYLLKWKLIFALQKVVGASDFYTKLEQFEATDALVDAIARDLPCWRPHVKGFNFVGAATACIVKAARVRPSSV